MGQGAGRSPGSRGAGAQGGSDLFQAQIPGCWTENLVEGRGTCEEASASCAAELGKQGGAKGRVVEPLPEVGPWGTLSLAGEQTRTCGLERLLGAVSMWRHRSWELHTLLSRERGGSWVAAMSQVVRVGEFCLRSCEFQLWQIQVLGWGVESVGFQEARQLKGDMMAAPGCVGENAGAKGW